MQEQEIAEEQTRDLLKYRRNALLQQFMSTPSNTRLAIEIKLIDDRIAELTGCLAAKRKSRRL